MQKILGILGAMVLSVSSGSSLVSCDDGDIKPVHGIFENYNFTFDKMYIIINDSDFSIIGKKLAITTKGFNRLIDGTDQSDINGLKERFDADNKTANGADKTVLIKNCFGLSRDDVINNENTEVKNMNNDHSAIPASKDDIVHVEKGYVIINGSTDNVDVHDKRAIIGYDMMRYDLTGKANKRNNEFVQNSASIQFTIVERCYVNYKIEYLNNGYQ